MAAKRIVRRLLKNGAKKGKDLLETGVKTLGKNGNGKKNGNGNGREILKARRDFVPTRKYINEPLSGPIEDRPKLRDLKPGEREPKSLKEAAYRKVNRYTPADKQRRDPRPKRRAKEGLWRYEAEKMDSRKQNSKGNKSIRQQKIKDSTKGKSDFYKGKGSNKDDSHHMRGVDQWHWLFDGLNKSEKGLFHDLLAKNGLATGDNHFNRADLPKIVHDALHDFMRERGFLAPKQSIKHLKYNERQKYVTQAIKDTSVIDRVMYALMNQYRKGSSVDLSIAKEKAGV